MSQTATIRVSQVVRDRLAERARRGRLTIAAVIERALDEADDRDFWAAITDDHAHLTPQQRAAYISDRTAADNLDGDADVALSLRDNW